MSRASDEQAVKNLDAYLDSIGFDDAAADKALEEAAKNCIQCGGPPTEPHPCPAIIRYFKDSKILCTCCENCQKGCG